MSLNATIAQGVEQAFTAAADLVSTGTYTIRNGPATYNPTNDTYTASTVTYNPVRMVRATLTNEEREASSISVSDVKVLIPAVDLAGTKPTETDVFVLDGLSYNVLNTRGVPGNSLWIVYAREK